MAHRVEQFETVCPAASSVSDTLAFTGGDGEVVKVEVRFPKGCNLLVRARIRYAAVQVIPFDTTKAMKLNGHTYSADISGYPVGAAWSMGVANDDIYSHTLRTTFYIDEVVAEDVAVLPQVIMLPLVS